MELNEKQRKLLYQKLYMLARDKILKQFRGDVEEVKLMRDAFVWDNYEKMYNELTDKELVECIKKFEKVGLVPDINDKVTKSTPNQIKIYHFYALSCALVYCNLDDCQFIDKSTGEIYQGNSLRKMASSLFDSKTGLPNGIRNYLFTNWINPRSHEYLVSGGYKKYVKNPNSFYVEQLSKEELDYLIRRYTKIFEKVSQKRIVEPSLN